MVLWLQYETPDFQNNKSEYNILISPDLRLLFIHSFALVLKKQ